MIDQKYKADNGLMTKEIFNNLAEAHHPNCVSIFIPTARAGESVDSGEGKIRLKNSLKEVRKILEDKGLNTKERSIILNPIEKLLDEDQFWRNQSDGLAIFSNGKEMHYFTMPLNFNQLTYVNNHYYLLPVIPFFNDNGKYYLLAISAQHVKLYEGMKHSIAEIEVSDLTPDRLEDAVGYDYEEKSVQNRSGQGGEGSGAMFHGQGAGKDDKKIETEKFFKAVDDGIMEFIGNEKAPLVLACVDEYYPIYKNITAYQHLSEDHVSGNPDESDPLLLHEKSWPLVEGYFTEAREKKAKQLRNELTGKKASTDIREIIPATADGRVDTLFAEEGKDLFGIYDQSKRKVELAEPGDRTHQVSLYNMAAVNTLLHGGEVFLAERDELPVEETELDALLRY